MKVSSATAVFQTAPDPNSSRGLNLSATSPHLSDIFVTAPHRAIETESLKVFRCFFAEGEIGGLYACGATFQYMVPLPNFVITLLFSKMRLKRKDFQEILRLPWAQEVPSSNLGAPTKTSRVFSLPYLKLSSLNILLWNSARQEGSIRKSFSFQKFAA
jgi:hypothetical protein